MTEFWRARQSYEHCPQSFEQAPKGTVITLETTSETGRRGRRFPSSSALGAPRRECRAVTGSFRLMRAIAVPTGPGATDQTCAGRSRCSAVGRGLRQPAPADSDRRRLQFPVPRRSRFGARSPPGGGGLRSSPHPPHPSFPLHACPRSSRPFVARSQASRGSWRGCVSRGRTISMRPGGAATCPALALAGPRRGRAR
ncbi:MAG: hypothetical protein K0S86_4748 [Geminicoccaceae bacterium]|nr:hypothetical protein [Geminicoccaceae bacterium]